MPEDTNTLTYTTNEDGTITVRDSEGNEVRYAKEADLLAVKGSREAAEKRAREEVKNATYELESTRQKALQAEATIASLEEKLKEATGSAEELAKVRQELEAAKKSGEELANKALEYRKQIITSTYGIPADAVKDKTMEELDYYEEALKSVMAAKGIGNYAVGGGGGGQSLEGLKPMDLARMAYSQKNK